MSLPPIRYNLALKGKGLDEVAYQASVGAWLKEASQELDAPVLIKPRAKYRGSSWKNYNRKV